MEEVKQWKELYLSQLRKWLKILGISKPYAYKIIKQMNEDLEANGFITISGKVSKKYFEEKFYGVETA